MSVVNSKSTSKWKKQYKKIHARVSGDFVEVQSDVN